MYVMYVIEIDVDGVILDTYTGLTDKVKHFYDGFDAERDIHSWSMVELDDLKQGLRAEVFKLFGDVDYMSSLPFYSCALDALKRLSDYCITHDAKIMLNTLMFTQEIANKRVNFFEDIFRTHGIKAEITAPVNKKSQLNAYIIIEDNVDNISNSSAEHKILIRHGHNRHFDASDCTPFKSFKAVNSFNEAVNYIIEGELCNE